MKSNKIRLTHNAEKQLELFKEEQVRHLMDIIKEGKYYPGLDEVEVTASDILKYGKRIDVYNEKKKLSITLLAWIYMLIGFFSVFFGFNYDLFYKMVQNSPAQLMAILLGAFLIFFAFVILIWNKSRNKSMERDQLLYRNDKKTTWDDDWVQQAP